MNLSVIIPVFDDESEAAQSWFPFGIVAACEKDRKTGKTGTVSN